VKVSGQCLIRDEGQAFTVLIQTSNRNGRRKRKKGKEKKIEAFPYHDV